MWLGLQVDKFKYYQSVVDNRTCSRKTKNNKVQPLFKKGDEERIENYRPISLLTSVSKVFEKVVFLQLTKYFQDNGLFYDGQYGFRENHSTEMATVELIDRIISALDDKQLPISIFMDLSKAFDTLNHDILLDKLTYYGVEGTALQWFDSYFYPTVLCMWKLIIWNHQYEPLPLVYHKVPYWSHFFFWFTWTISRTQEISSNLYCLQTTQIVQYHWIHTPNSYIKC